MIPNEGKVLLLDSQNTFWGGCQWALFKDDVTIDENTTIADLGDEADWSGYARVNSGSPNAASLVANKAVASFLTLPAFTNTSGAPVDFYVIALIHVTGPTLVDARNIGLTSIADSSFFIFAGAVTDDQE